jgi:N-methylhydantoinase A
VQVERRDDGRRDVAVHDRDALRPGQALFGPALVDSSDTTIWIPAGMTAFVNSEGSLVMECQSAQSRPANSRQMEPMA